jgi:hypothetical protein
MSRTTGWQSDAPAIGSRLRRGAAITAVGLAAALASCSGTDSTPPVAGVAVSASQSHAVAGGPLHLSYTFTLAPDARMDGDYGVFVQGFDDRGHQVWHDDHEPPLPTSRWRPGQQVQYTRTAFLPIVSYVGPLTIEIGLYRDDARLPIAGPDGAAVQDGRRAYRMGTIQVLPQAAGMFVEFGEGWHDQEFADDDPAITWRWTRSSAMVTFDNPREPIELYLEYDVPALVFADPQQIVISVDGQAVATVESVSERTNAHRIPLTAPQLGGAERVQLRLDVTPAFIPAEVTASPDTRELGVRVRHLHLQRRDSPADLSSPDAEDRQSGAVNIGRSVE